MAKLKVNRGTTYTINFAYKKDNVAETLVGATVSFTMKSAEFDTDSSDASAAVKKDVTSGNSQGLATIIINPADTISLVPGTYFYDLKVKEAGGAVYKVDEGTIILDGSPTNRLV